jgi:hypothetical protein
MLYLEIAAIVTLVLGWILLVIFMHLREELRMQWCVCGHSQAKHDMTLVSSSAGVQVGRCLECICRAFHRDHSK